MCLIVIYVSLFLKLEKGNPIFIDSRKIVGSLGISSSFLILPFTTLIFRNNPTQENKKTKVKT